MKRFFISLIVMIMGTALKAQTTGSSETLWTSGKIFVVLTVVMTIFAGIVALLVWIERRLRQLEK